MKPLPVLCAQFFAALSVLGQSHAFPQIVQTYAQLIRINSQNPVFVLRGDGSANTDGGWFEYQSTGASTNTYSVFDTINADLLAYAPGKKWTRVSTRFPQPVLISSTKTGTYTTTTQDFYVPVDTTAGNVTVNLIAVASFVHRPLVIKNISGANNVIIDPSGAETIDGNATITLGPRQTVSILSRTSTWDLLAWERPIQTGVTLSAGTVTVTNTSWNTGTAVQWVTSAVGGTPGAVYTSSISGSGTIRTFTSTSATDASTGTLVAH